MKELGSVCLVVVSLVLVGCGGSAGRFPGAPAEGSKCTATQDRPQCSSDSTAAYCIADKWTDYDCYGTCGGEKSLCDFRNAKAGDVCPNLDFRFGHCRSATEQVFCDKSVIVIKTCTECVTNEMGSACN